MKRLAIPAAAAAVALVASFGYVRAAAAQTPADRAAIEKQIVANERAVNEAFAKGDAKGFMAHVDKAGVSVDMMGVMKVTEFEKMLKDTKVESWNIAQSQFVWVNPQTVIHIYRWTGKGTFQGQPFPSPTWASTVWTTRDGKWVAIFHQETMAAPPPKK